MSGKHNDSGENTLYQRSLRASLFIGLLSSLFILVYGGPRVALFYFGAFAWMMVNLLIWQFSLKEYLIKRRFLPSVVWILLKLAWIFLLAVLAGISDIGQSTGVFVAFLLGFHTPFLVLLLKAIGKWLTQKK